MRLETGTIIDGKYVLERLLGEGGMGAVWLSRHRVLGAPLAIKFLRADRHHNVMARRRFEREAKAAANLRTRHAVSVHDYGVDGYRAYIVMEMLEGEDLGVRLKRHGRLPPQESLRILMQAARGLHHAHAAGIIHRDLKPANIFLARDEGEEVVKILDFGIAKLTEDDSSEETTKTGVLLGSPHYMSPEHIRGQWKQLDHRSDLWSLAVIAFRVLTGKMPFLGEVLGQVMQAICYGTPPSVSSLVDDLPPSLDAFFDRALAREPAARFQSAEALAAALHLALPGAARWEAWSLPGDGAPVVPELPSGDGPTLALDDEETPPPATQALPKLQPPPPPAQRLPPPLPPPAPSDGLGSVTERGVVRPRPAPSASRAASVAPAIAVLLMLGVTSWGLASLHGDRAGAPLEPWLGESGVISWADEIARDQETEAEPPRPPRDDAEVAPPPSAQPPRALPPPKPPAPAAGESFDFGY